MLKELGQYMKSRQKTKKLKKKFKPVAKAARKIEQLEKSKTERTRTIERQTGAESDIRKVQRQIAKNARMKMKGR